MNREMKIDSWTYATIFTRSATAPDTTVAAVAGQVGTQKQPIMKKCYNDITTWQHNEL